MTVKELIDILEDYDPDMEVCIGMQQDYGSNFAMEVQDVEEHGIRSFYGDHKTALVITQGSQNGIVDYNEDDDLEEADEDEEGGLMIEEQIRNRFMDRAKELLFSDLRMDKAMILFADMIINNAAGLAVLRHTKTKSEVKQMPDEVLIEMEDEIVARFMDKVNKLLDTDPRMDTINIQYAKENLKKAAKTYDRLYRREN